MIKLKNNYSKVCGVAYDFKDITRIVKFSNKHNFIYFYIKHFPDDENDKIHYHFIIYSNVGKRFIVDSLITETFKLNLFQECVNVGAYLRYMIHIDFPLKKQYIIDKIKSNMSLPFIQNLIDNFNKTKVDINKENFNILCDLILSDNFVSLKDVIRYCLDNDIKYNTSWSFTFKELLK